MIDKEGKMYFFIKEINVEYTKGYKNEPIQVIGNEKAVLDFVNDRNEDEIYQEIDVAIKWLKENGYEIMAIEDFIARLQNGDQVWL